MVGLERRSVEHQAGQFDERTYLITGAGSGIARSVASALSDAGARVVLVGRTVGTLEGTAELCRPGSALVVVADVADDGGMQRAVAAACERFGRLDGAFNGAGVFGEFGRLDEDELDNFDHVVGVNLRGVWSAMRHELRALVDGGGGSIVNCGSVASHRGHLRSPLYSATKHAVIGLTKSAALQYAGDRIRVNAVSPGSTDTAMLRSIYVSDEDLEARARRAPLGRFGKPDEVAQAALWLLSDASSYVTGQSLIVDGGVTAAAM